MKYPCAYCDHPGTIEKWFACPGVVYRPNAYLVCVAHKDEWLTWEEVYPDECGEPVLKHMPKKIKEIE